LAEADNLRAPAVVDPGPSAATTDWLPLLRAVSKDLGVMDASAIVLRRTLGGAYQQRVALDLIQAQAWRSAWMGDAAPIVDGRHQGGRPATLAAVFDRVRAGFEPQARLTRIHFEFVASPAVAALQLDGDLGVAAITGCLFATLAWLEDSEDARVEIRADAPNSRTLRVEVVQRTAAVPEDAIRSLREGRFSQTPDLTVWLGLLTAKAAAEKDGGTVDLTAIGDQGSVIKTLFQICEK
jgi:hypothetical protein